MALLTGFFKELLNNDVAQRIITIGADAGKRTYAVFGGPGAAAAAVTAVNAFSAFNQRQDFFAGNQDRILIVSTSYSLYQF